MHRNQEWKLKPKPENPVLKEILETQTETDIFVNKVKSADIRESLNIELLLLRLERSQLRWYGHVTRIYQERTAKKLLCSTPIGRRPRGRPRTRWQDYAEDLSWSRLGIPAEHLSFVAEDPDAWRLQLKLLFPRPLKDKRVQKID